MPAVTKRQREVLDFIQGFEADRNYSPSYQEIAEGLGLSSIATVHKHVHNLKRKQLHRTNQRYIATDRAATRWSLLPLAFVLLTLMVAAGEGAFSTTPTSEKVLKPLASTVEVVARRMTKLPVISDLGFPLLGKIAAGQPIEAISNQETISLSDIARSRGEVYVLEVKGDSMQDEHIIEKDYVLVEKTNTARDGEIVVALVNGADATLKRLYREGAMIRLQPSNASMKPMRYPAQSVQVQGRVVGVLRRY